MQRHDRFVNHSVYCCRNPKAIQYASPALRSQTQALPMLARAFRQDSPSADSLFKHVSVFGIAASPRNSDPAVVDPADVHFNHNKAPSAPEQHVAHSPDLHIHSYIAWGRSACALCRFYSPPSPRTWTLQTFWIPPCLGAFEGRASVPCCGDLCRSGGRRLKQSTRNGFSS